MVIDEDMFGVLVSDPVALCAVIEGDCFGVES
jgi:hypothetical protein